MMRKFLPVTVAVMLCCAAAFAGKKKAGAEFGLFGKKLNKDEQILHALDRLTFGPRPGDVAIVKKLGVKKWIELQLNPEKIAENPELERRLEPLESLHMSQAQTASSYTPRQLIRQVAMGRQPLPEDPVARAAVERQVKRYKFNNKLTDDNDAMQPAVPLKDLLAPRDIQTLRNGTTDQKRFVLASIDADKVDDTIIAMPQQLRNQLQGVASPWMRRKMILANNPQQVVFYDLAEAKLYRAIYSNRQLSEELADFWFNHFNVYIDKGADRFLIPTYERETIRPHVLGHFRDLLEATATSPAMLFYLDNWQSVAPGIANRPNGNRPQRGLNENYARELMELHTLGVDGGYTQKDVTEVARCFTGWTIREPRREAVFEFNPRMHDNGEKLVLDVRIPAGGGRDDGEKVLDILARQPATARFVSRDLAMRFVADDPPEPLVDRMAATYLKKDGDLRAVLKTMFDSPEFWSRGAYRSKMKSPLEMVASSLRAVNADVA